MAKRKSKSETNLKQLDIVSAMKNVDKFIEPEEEFDEEIKALTPFDIINDIKNIKSLNLLDKEQNMNLFNQFLIIYGLSMDQSLVPFVNDTVNKYSGVMDKKTMYWFLTTIIPKDKTFYKWISQAKEKESPLIGLVATYYECSHKEAEEYVNIMGTAWAKEIQEKFGDFV